MSATSPFRRLGAWLLVLAVSAGAATGCATSAPVVERGGVELAKLVGAWSGTAGRKDMGSSPWDLVIRADGRFESHTLLGSTMGVITIEGNQVRMRADQTGRTGILTLVEDQGSKPRLLYQSDDGLAWAEAERAGPR